MVKSAITVSLVEAARGGPFVLWDGLEAGCKTAKELGFDAIEVFSLGPEQVDSDELEKLLQDHELSLAAVGTGAGKVKHGLSLCTLADGKLHQCLRCLNADEALLPRNATCALCNGAFCAPHSVGPSRLV